MATESRFTNVSRVMSTLIPHLVHDSPFPHNSQTPPSKPVKYFDLLTRSSYGLVYTFAFSFSKQLSRFDSSVVNSRNKATKLSSKLSELIGERLAFIPAETDEPLERTRIERAHQRVSGLSQAVDRQVKSHQILRSLENQFGARLSLFPRLALVTCFGFVFVLFKAGCNVI